MGEAFELAGYRAIEQIGAGAAATVYRGIRVADGRPVALKVMAATELVVLEREAALAAVVDHAHLPEVLAVLADTERAVLVTELAAGGTLADLLDRRGSLPVGEALTVLLPIASALATAHERGVVHGDLSAANILFDLAGRPLLADLGAARAAMEVGRPVAATPTDVAPELARGQQPTAASDLFSLGSLALACLTGRHAWPAQDLRDVMIQSTAGQWPDPAPTVTDPELAALIRSLLDPLPQARPGAAAVVMDLRAIGSPTPVQLPEPAGETGAGTAPQSDTAPQSGTAKKSGAARHRAPELVPATAIRPPAIDPGRAERARAVTVLRPDAAPVVHQQPAPPARGRGIRVAVVTLLSVALGLAAVQLGLWWAGWDGPDPVTAPPPPTPAVAAPASSSSTPTPITRSARSTTPPALTTRPAATDWAAVIAELDRTRGSALVARDIALLDRVYTAAAPGRAADSATIGTLLERGWTVSGAAHLFRSVVPVAGTGRIVLRVTDVLPAYRIVDAAGRVIGTTAGRDQRTRVITLQRVSDGYRIVDIDS